MQGRGGVKGRCESAAQYERNRERTRGHSLHFTQRLRQSLAASPVGCRLPAAVVEPGGRGRAWRVRFSARRPQRCWPAARGRCRRCSPLAGGTGLHGAAGEGWPRRWARGAKQQACRPQPMGCRTHVHSLSGAHPWHSCLPAAAPGHCSRPAAPPARPAAVACAPSSCRQAGRQARGGKRALSKRSVRRHLGWGWLAGSIVSIWLPPLPGSPGRQAAGWANQG